MTNQRKPPRWTVAFLRALERTGSPELAAADAGIDRTTAYARRKAHPDFAQAWEAALRGCEGRAEDEVRERVGFWEKVRGKVTPKMLASVDEPGTNGTEQRQSLDSVRTNGMRKDELLASSTLGGKLVRPGPGRWNAAAEERFFSELAATANVKRACAAAGVSTNAVYARRLKRPDFRAKWDAVLETGRAAVEMHLVEAAKKSFDPDELDVGEAAGARVSVTEAIRIVQLQGKMPGRNLPSEPSIPPDDIEVVRERVFQKLQRLRKREMERKIGEGWSYDESRDVIVPPGWMPARADGVA